VNWRIGDALFYEAGTHTVFMSGWWLLRSRRSLVAGWLLVSLVGSGRLFAEPSAAAVTAFNAYVSGVEARLARQHGLQKDFVVIGGTQNEERLRSGELLVEQLSPSVGADVLGALLHHWRGTAFVPGGKVGDFERMLRDFNAYPQYFSPEVVRAKMVMRGDGHLQAEMRVRQKHVITVVMDTAYDVTFGRLDAQRGYSVSRSVRISEIDAPGTNRERTLSSSEEHGFLWRQNTYWSYEERDGGLYVQIESVSLSRAIPVGLGWALRPYVESVPRESLEFTLRSARKAMEKGA
jgi:hypothetical protein